MTPDRLTPPYLDFLMLGLAAPAPRGAMAVAPRAALRPAFTITDAYPRMCQGFQQQVLLSYLLPLGQTSAGPAFTGNQLTGLVPNPYIGP